MSEANVELVRRLIETWLGGDAAGALALMADDVVVTQPPHQVDARTYEGHDGLMQAMADWGGQWDDWRFELQRLIDADDTVVAVMLQSGRGKSSGVEVTTTLGSVFHVADGKVSRWQMFFSEAEALAAAGLG